MKVQDQEKPKRGRGRPPKLRSNSQEEYEQMHATQDSQEFKGDYDDAPQNLFIANNSQKARIVRLQTQQQTRIQQEEPEKRSIQIKVNDPQKTYIPVRAESPEQEQLNQQIQGMRIQEDDDQLQQFKKPGVGVGNELNKQRKEFITELDKKRQLACMDFRFDAEYTNDPQPWEIDRCQKNVKILLDYTKADVFNTLIHHFRLTIIGLARFTFPSFDAYLIKVNVGTIHCLTNYMIPKSKLLYMVNNKIIEQIWKGEIKQCLYPDRYENVALMHAYMKAAMHGQTFSLEYEQQITNDNIKIISDLKLPATFHIGKKHQSWILFLHFENPIATICSLIFNPSCLEYWLSAYRQRDNMNTCICAYLKRKDYLLVTADYTLGNQENELYLEEYLIADPKKYLK